MFYIYNRRRVTKLSICCTKFSMWVKKLHTELHVFADSAAENVFYTQSPKGVKRSKFIVYTYGITI